MNISKHKIYKLRGEAHHLSPVVIIGAKGLTESVYEEIDRALNDHELIKIKVNGYDGEQKGKMCEEICDKLDVTLIQAIGHVLVLYRPAEEE